MAHFVINIAPCVAIAVNFLHDEVVDQTMMLASRECPCEPSLSFGTLKRPVRNELRNDGILADRTSDNYPIVYSGQLCLLCLCIVLE